jgi:voltage-gated potassium channel
MGRHSLGPSTHQRRWLSALTRDPLVTTAVLLLSVLLGGTLGYVLIEGWTVWEAFYMTVISVTTVGYREVRPMGRAGEAFTVVVLISGVGMVLYSISMFAGRVVENGLQHRWERRWTQRMLDKITDHFIVCGYGRIGSVMVDEFERQGVPYVVIDRDPARIAMAKARGSLVVDGDASSEETLKQAGLNRAKAFIAALSTDAENVYAILSARLTSPGLYIIGRAETEESARKLRTAGADRVISPYQIGGLHMAQLAMRPAVVEFVQLATSAEFLDLSMEQVEVGEGSSLVDQTLVGCNVRQRFGVIVVGIQRASGTMEFNPSPDAVIRKGDRLVVMGPADRLKELESVSMSKKV